MAQPGGGGNDDERVRAEALQIIDLHRILPRLVVFDLDYTLWPFYSECCYEDGMQHLYQLAKGIILALKDKWIDIASASRSPTPEIAKRFLDKLGIRSIFVAEGVRVKIDLAWRFILAGRIKMEHFDKIHRTIGVPYSCMLFFDDENRNIEAVSKMVVTSKYVNKRVGQSESSEGGPPQLLL